MTTAAGGSPARHDASARFLPVGEICNSRGSNGRGLTVLVVERRLNRSTSRPWSLNPAT
jgi:hypothetical protein